MSHEQTRFSGPMQDNPAPGSKNEELYQNIDDYHSIAEFLKKTRSPQENKEEEEEHEQAAKEEAMQKKKAYFQGGGGENQPTPKKKKYKSDRAIVVQPRFKEPLYHNYDLYETEGVDGPAKHGPGTGLYQNQEKYKSVSDFLDKKRKRNKDKYKADDSYIEDDGSITKYKNKVDRMAKRAALLRAITKTAIDFPIDDLIESGPILGDSGTVSDSVPIGGQLDEYLTNPDAEGKDPAALNFGRDYSNENKVIDYIAELQDLLDELLKLNPKEADLMGTPQGISPPEDLDAPSDPDIDYGTTDSGNTFYNKMWI